jgi:hypothetical protein
VIESLERERLNEMGHPVRVSLLVGGVFHYTGDRYVDETKPADHAEKDTFNLIK